MNLLKTAKILLTAVTVSISGMVMAQDSIPVHFDMHRNMLADQINMYKEVNLLDSLTLIYRLQEDASEIQNFKLYASWSKNFVDHL